MKDNALRSAVTRAVLTELAAGGEFWAPVATSSRHCHLSPADLERLFGPGHELTPMRMLEQPGQFAAEGLDAVDFGEHALQGIQVCQFLFHAVLSGVFLCFFSCHLFYLCFACYDFCLH